MIAKILLLAVLVLLIFASAAKANSSVVYGVSDPGFSRSWPSMSASFKALGATQVGLWVRYDGGPTPPLGVPLSQPALVILAGSPSYFPLTAAKRTLYAARAAALVKANPNIRELQVWSEAEGNFSAAQYVPLLAATYDAVHAASGSVSVLGWGAHPDAIVADGKHPGWMHMTITSFATEVTHELQAGRTQPLMDGFAYHPYWNWSAPLTRQLADYLNQVWASGAQPDPRRGLRFWWTETGAWSNGAQWGIPSMVLGPLGQANRVYDVAREARCNRYVAGDFNYLLADEPGTSYTWHIWKSGLLEVDGRRKPAFNAFRVAASEAKSGMSCLRSASARPWFH